MAESKHTQISVRRTTLARLKAEIVRRVTLAERGAGDLPNRDRDPINPATPAISIDELINLLLDGPVRHKRRADKSRAKARAAKKKGATT